MLMVLHGYNVPTGERIGSLGRLALALMHAKGHTV
jgi:hypothetical protein